MGNQVVFVTIMMVISIGISGLLISLLLSLEYIRGVGGGGSQGNSCNVIPWISRFLPDLPCPPQLLGSYYV